MCLAIQTSETFITDMEKKVQKNMKRINNNKKLNNNILEILVICLILILEEDKGILEGSSNKLLIFFTKMMLWNLIYNHFQSFIEDKMFG